MSIDDIIQQRRDWRKNIPDLRHGAYRRLYDKAMSGHSLRAAVSSKCLDCMCWQKNEVRDCDIVSCPLHPYRPYKGRSARQRASGEGFSEQTPQKAVDIPSPARTEALL